MWYAARHILGILPGWFYALLLALALGLWGLAAHSRNALRLELALERETHATQLAVWQAAAAQAEARERDKEARYRSVIKEAQDNELKARKARDAARTRADTAARRLRDAYAATAAGLGASGGDATTAARGPTTRASADLLADVQRRIDEAAGTIGRYADEAAAAGRTCEVIHEPLTTR